MLKKYKGIQLRLFRSSTITLSDASRKILHVLRSPRRSFCERCQNTGYECEGYVREHRFVDEVSRTIRDTQKDQVSAFAFAARRFNNELISVRGSSPTVLPTLVCLHSKTTCISLFSSQAFLLASLCRSH
jgi:hypothetical protein